MTGTDVMSRRHNNLDLPNHDYLGGTGIVKSKTSIAITGSNHRNHHGDHINKMDKRFDRSSRTSGNNNSFPVTKSGGSGGPGGNSAGQVPATRKNSRQRQRQSDNKAASKTKPSKDDVTMDSKNSPVPSVLPPIAMTITNSKNGERSPRLLETSAGNMPPSLTLAPTRLAIRQSASPDPNSTIHDAVNSTSLKTRVPSSNSNNDNNNNYKINSNNSNKNNNPQDLNLSLDATNNAKHSTTLQTPGTKRNSMSRNDSINCIRLSNINNINTTNNNNNNNDNNNTNPNPNNNSVTSPQPRSPRLVTETSRLSPINSHDKPKIKFEKKVMKYTMDNSMPTSPRTFRLGSSDTIPQPHQQTKQEGKGNITQRKQSIKSLPRLTPAEEQFSIRRKIEQFRKWHEEQHADNLKRLPGEDSQEVFKTGVSAANSRPSIPGLDPLVPTCPADVMDFAKLLEDKIIQNNIPDDNKATMVSDRNGEGKDARNNDNNNNDDNNDNKKGDAKKASSTNAASKGKRINNKSKNRPISGATWKTWRGINESDAYNDVKKYIDDNDLMDPEREEWIKSWIQDVGVAMSERADSGTPTIQV